jgi:hypothetical protein
MIIQYITKGKKNVENRPTNIEESGIWGQRKGVMVGYKHIDEETNESKIYIGFSLKNKKEWDWDIQFCRDTALRKALGKAYGLSSIVVIPEGSIKYNGLETIYFKEVINEIPYSIRHDMFRFIDRCKRYYKDATLAPFWERMDTVLQETFLLKALKKEY